MFTTASIVRIAALTAMFVLLDSVGVSFSKEPWTYVGMVACVFVFGLACFADKGRS